MKLLYRKSIFAVVYRREKDKILYLVLKRKLHWKGWEFPKGGIEKKEINLSTVFREIKEETGQKPLNLKKYNISGKFKYDRIFQDRPEFSGQSYNLFSAEIKKSKIKIDKKEHYGYKWVSFKKALSLLTWPNQRKCLKIVNRSLTK